MDRFGVHAECCTAGGDRTYGHHTVRNDLYAQAKRGLGSAVLEAKGVLDVLQCEQGGAGSGRGRERPADVLLAQARDVRTGASGVVTGKVALDVGIVCPQASGHLSEAAGEQLGAAERYARHKCGHHSVERRCRENGVVFQPMIFGSTGGGL